MIPYRGPHRPHRRDRTCCETGQPMHQDGAFGANRRMTPRFSCGSKSIHYYRLRRKTERFPSARIVHSPQLPAEGSRQTRSTIIEET